MEIFAAVLHLAKMAALVVTAAFLHILVLVQMDLLEKNVRKVNDATFKWLPFYIASTIYRSKLQNLYNNEMKNVNISITFSIFTAKILTTV